MFQNSFLLMFDLLFFPFFDDVDFWCFVFDFLSKSYQEISAGNRFVGGDCLKMKREGVKEASIFSEKLSIFFSKNLNIHQFIQNE